jgi:hypothetical protein
MPRDQVFISYSHKDKKWYDDLDTHLKPYLRGGSIVSWSDQQIAPGSEWFRETQSALANSKVAVLLVSPDFLASNFIYEYELGPLLKEANRGGVTILWVPIYASAYKQTELEKYQSVLDPNKPLGSLSKAKRDEAWVTICEEIQEAVNEPRKPRGPPPMGLIASIEFTLECPFIEFNEAKFKIALKAATGIDASQIRIASIRSGSTIVKIDGEQETLAAIIRKIQSSQQVAHQLALQTGMRKMAWEIDGKRYELNIGDTTITEVVLLIHGIRDFAEWQDMVSTVLTEIPNIEVCPLKYGRFDAFRFWFPIWTRGAPVTKLLWRIREARDSFSNAKLSVIAHSFGTYAIGKILKDNPDVHLHRLILCGAILPSDCRWDQIPRGVETPIINDCGIKDIWPVLATSTTFGYGPSGRFGFGTPGVRDRYHSFGHGGFFNKEFVRRFWLPWFQRGELVRSETPAPSGLRWHILTVFQLKWLTVILCILGLSAPLLLPPAIHPKIQFTDIPSAGYGGPVNKELIAGRITGVTPKQRLVIYSLASNGVLYVQPDAATPFTNIAADGTFEAYIYLGQAYYVLVVEAGFKPAAQTIAIPQRGGNIVAVFRVNGRKN